MEDGDLNRKSEVTTGSPPTQCRTSSTLNGEYSTGTPVAWDNVEGSFQTFKLCKYS